MKRSTATIPDARGFRPEQAADLVTSLLGYFQLASLSLADFLIWQRLVKDFQVVGTQVHEGDGPARSTGGVLAKI